MINPGLGSTRWYAPVPLPAGAHLEDISHFPVATGRNAVNQGGVGGYPNGANWRGNPTTMPFTAQPGPVYDTHMPFDQPYRKTAGYGVNIVTVTPALPPFVLQRQPAQSGGVAVANQVRQRMLALLALRQRSAAAANAKR